MTINLSRRRFFAASAAGLVTSGLSTKVLASEDNAIHWDKTVDFLIVGTGFAGLAGALEAHYQGMKNILVVEKMPTPGGNSIINGGAISAAGTDMQKKLGIEDNPDLMFKDIMHHGGHINHPELARKIADESVANYEWLKNEIGVHFSSVYYHGGHSVKRSHGVEEKCGAGFINPMLAKCKEFNIPIRLNTKVVDLITNEKGCVLGVRVETHYRNEKGKGTGFENIRSIHGVLIASGGFSQNVQMRMSHDPRLTKAFGSTNHAGATGEMIRLAQRKGANTIHMDWIQLGPWTSPDEKGFGKAPLFVESLVGYGCMVDIKTGKRFFKETGNRKERADAIVALGHPALIYAGAANVKNQVPKTMNAEMLETSIKNGVIGKFDTLKQMADFYHIPYEALEKQNERMNGFLKNKQDPDLGCKFFPDSLPNDKGPFYAVRLWPRVHHTMGGLEINDKAQVIDGDGKPIAGLYAAGEVTGGVHGMVRLGTVAVADCMIIGRTAARTAAAFNGC